MFRFEKLRISTRLMVAGVAVLIGLALLATHTLIQTRNDSLQAHNVRLKDLVETAQGVVAYYQELASGKKLSREEAQERAKEALRPLRFGNDDYFFVYDFEGRALMVAGSPKIEGQVMLGKTDNKGFKLWDAFVAIGKGPGKGYVEYWFPRAGQTEPKPKLAYLMAIPEWRWIVGTGVYVDDVDSAVQSAALDDVGLSLLTLLVVTVIAYGVSRSIVRQLGGEPAAAIELMSRAARGDLNVDFGSSATGSILDSAAHMVHSIRGMVSEIAESSERLTHGSERIHTASQEIALASQRQTDATQSMAAAVEEMMVGIKHVSESAAQTHESSVSSAELSEDGFARIQVASEEIDKIAAIVGDASGRIGKLEERAKQISSIVGVIKEIAGQTNLLALNAAIEAARAGEQGRGFAIVADEVRKLAERTASATVEIEQMTAGIQSDTVVVVEIMGTALPQIETGARAAGEVADSMRQIKEKSHFTLSSIEEIARATQEQSAASDNIAHRIEQISQMLQETNQAMRASAETASEMNEIAGELRQSVTQFRY